MKSIKYSLLISILLLLYQGCLACGYDWSEVSTYHPYRILDDKQKDNKSFSDRNCLEWQQLTSEDVLLEDIYEAVYETSLDEIERIRNLKNYRGNNSFWRYAVDNNHDILEFVYIAKMNESIRFRYNSEWYYPTMEMDFSMDLFQIIDISLANQTSLRDRYLLQAVRALVTLNRHEEVVSLWFSEISKMPDDSLMKDMILPYVAGSMSRFDEYRDEAIRLFVELDDTSSILYLLRKDFDNLSDVDILSIIYQYAPNSESIYNHLNSIVSNIENGAYTYSQKNADVVNELYALSTRVVREGKSPNAALWYYTAAFIADNQGRTEEASTLLEYGEKLVKSEFLAESMQVFRIYLDAKRMTYNADYERHLLSQLKWLHNQIIDDIDRDYVPIYGSLHELDSYWYDSMHHIILYVVCPRMIEAGKLTRALQLANMADYMGINHIAKIKLGICYDKVENQWIGGGDNYGDIVSIDEYRYDDKRRNDIDFSSSFFHMIYDMGLKQAEIFYNRVKYPQDSFDKFLKDKIYVDKEFMCDILGTLSLKEMQYAKAEKYLSQVDSSYDKCLNVVSKYDPFSYDKKYVGHKANFRLDFAREMARLEQQIAKSQDPNQKAMLMIRYAVALFNSFTRDWSLTGYGRMYTYIRHDEPYGELLPERDSYLDAVAERYNTLTQEALDMVTDMEVAADIHYLFANFRIIAELYPYTEKGNLVRGSCDRLIDYHSERALINRYGELRKWHY